MRKATRTCARRWEDASQIPAIAEPWFLALNASVAFHPVMVPDDLAKAASSIETAVNKYG